MFAATVILFNNKTNLSFTSTKSYKNLIKYIYR